MGDRRTTRRAFVVQSGLAAGAALLGTRSAPSFARQTPTLVRRNLKTLDRNGPEIARLRQAFQVLEDRTQSSPQIPTGWLVQANIHRDSCPHGNWWFFPWHRAYLYWFEQILQAAVNDPTLTIPYWDWSDPATRAIPVPYWWPYLYRVARGPGITWQSQVPAELVDLHDTVINPILDVSDFATFGGGAASETRQSAGAGWLEGSPHNNVHSWTGGAMGIVAWAAQDPIFWCHHANVDRLWVEWVARHPNALPTDTTWLNQSFPFVNASGQPVSMAVSQVLTTTGLGYEYETASTAPVAPHLAAREMAANAPGAEAKPATAAAAAAPALPNRVEVVPARPVLGARPVSVTLPTAAPAIRRHVESIVTNHLRNAPHGSVQLAIEGMQVPDRPQLLVRVFLNKPDADANTSFQDPHYAGNFSFFTMGRSGAHGPHGPTTQLLDVTRAISRLRAANEYQPGGPLTVTLVARPVGGGAAGAPAVLIPFAKVALTVIP